MERDSQSNSYTEKDVTLSRCVFLSTAVEVDMTRPVIHDKDCVRYCTYRLYSFSIKPE